MAPNNLQLQNYALNYNPNVNVGDNMLSMMQSYTGGMDLGNGINLNSVWSCMGNLEQMGSDNPDQQANAVQSLVNNIMGMLSKLGDGEAAAASSEVNSNQNSANKTVSFTEKEKSSINEKLESNSSQIESENKTLETAGKDAAELQKQIEEEQKKIQESLQNINTLQQQLGAETDPVEQKKLLSAITNELTAMNGSFTLVADLKTKLSDNCSQVEGAGKNLEKLATDSAETVENGANRLKELSGQAQQDAQKNTQTQTKAPINAATSAELASAAAAASSNIFTGSTVAQKLYRSSTDQGIASSVREAGAVEVWTKISQSISNVVGSFNTISAYDNTIGSAFKGSEGLIGSWANTLQPMITSVGSIETLQQDVEGKLQPAISKDNNTVDAQLEKEGKTVDTKSQETSTDIAAKGLIASMTGGAANSMVAKEQVNNLETPKVQIQFGL